MKREKKEQKQAPNSRPNNKSRQAETAPAARLTPGKKAAAGSRPVKKTQSRAEAALAAAKTSAPKAAKENVKAAGQKAAKKAPKAAVLDAPEKKKSARRETVKPVRETGPAKKAAPASVGNSAKTGAKTRPAKKTTAPASKSNAKIAAAKTLKSAPQKNAPAASRAKAKAAPESATAEVRNASPEKRTKTSSQPEPGKPAVKRKSAAAAPKTAKAEALKKAPARATASKPEKSTDGAGSRKRETPRKAAPAARATKTATSRKPVSTATGVTAISAAKKRAAKAPETNAAAKSAGKARPVKTLKAEKLIVQKTVRSAPKTAARPAAPSKSADGLKSKKIVKVTKGNEKLLKPERAVPTKKPENKRAKPIGSAVFRGKKEKYDFQVFSITEKFEPIRAVYVISKRKTDHQKRAHHALICIGATDSIAEEIKRHRRICLRKYGANVISILPVEDAQKRTQIETDLKAAHSISCTVS